MANQVLGYRLLRDATPGGNTEEVVDWGGWAFVVAETVANNNFSSTKTQADSMGKTELFIYVRGGQNF
jgi:hypothetical protein